MTAIKEELRTKSLNDLTVRFPVIGDFLQTMRMEAIDRSLPFAQALRTLPPELLADLEITADEMTEYLQALLDQQVNQEPCPPVGSLGILAGFDKDGKRESFAAEGSGLVLARGEVICVVGPTGSGKSRLLEDVDYLAQGDSPTGRTILINGEPVGDDVRFKQKARLVAQLSQNMNFVMDLTVEEFLDMHARCLVSASGGETAEGSMADRIRETFEQANALAGEPFSKEIKVTQLSGGQSRALMIADTACMSEAPVVLVDEIENAGIDRRQAVALLAKKEKIVLMATHDPLLILEADRRIVVANGGIQKILTTSEEEKQLLREIAEMDARLQRVREELRGGCRPE